MKKILMVLMVFLLTVSSGMVFAGGQQDEAAADTSGLPVVKMGLAMQSKMAPAFQAWEDYLYTRVQYEAKERGYVVEWTATNANGDSVKQANDIKDLLAKDCEVIFVPCNASQAILTSVEQSRFYIRIILSCCISGSYRSSGSGYNS